MGSFISRIIDIGFMPNAPWLYWLVFEHCRITIFKDADRGCYFKFILSQI